MIKAFYHFITLYPIRKKISYFRKERKMRKRHEKMQRLRQNVIQFLEENADSEEKQNILFYLKNHSRFPVFPYPYTEAYLPERIKVQRDADGFSYVVHHGKRLYGKKCWSIERFQEYYNSLLLEQDAASPHRYLKAGRYPIKGDIIADIGAAEGFFALDVIEQAGKVYLFECDKDWLEPLRRTFHPWLDKVVFVHKFVGDVTRRNTVTLDDYFRGKKLDYLKADIEGAEAALLLGGGNTFSKLKQALLCAYHRQQDEEIILNYLCRYGFSAEVNPGYMLYFLDSAFCAPYLRRGVIYAQKNSMVCE